MHRRCGRRRSTIASVVLLFVLGGCSSKHTGAGKPSTAAKLVDASWLTAVKACWPDLARTGASDDALSHDLATPAGFHSAFPVYAAQANGAVDDLLLKPLSNAPFPDTSKLLHSQTPVLTRGQAAHGVGPQGAVVASTNGIAPPDALCPIQPGKPQGF